MDIDEFLEKEAKNIKDVGPKAKILDTYMTKDINYQNKNIIIEINSIKAMMKEGKYGDAGKMYFVVRKRYSDLIRQQLEEKHQIYLELTNINKDLIENLNQQRVDMDNKINVIKELIKKGLQNLSGNDVMNANQIYLQIREVFRQLPDSFPEKKLLTENEVLSFYSSLMNKMNTNSRDKLLERSQEINDMITKAFELVNKNKAEEATKLYNDINRKYNELPQGFLYEKSLLYQKILKLYQVTEMVYEKNKVNQETVELPDTGSSQNADQNLADIPKDIKVDPLAFKNKKV